MTISIPKPRSSTPPSGEGSPMVPKAGTNTTVLRKNATAAPLSPLVPPRVGVPDEPVYDRVSEKVLYDEQQVTRVSILMAKGIREPAHLMKLLNIPERERMSRYMARVIARWEMAGSRIDHHRSRGEALQRLDLIEMGLWEQIEHGSPRLIDGVWTGTADTRANIAALKTLLDVSAHRSDIQGLTAKVIERLGLTTDESLEFTKRTAAHDKLAGLASKMLDMLDKRMPADPANMKTIDGTATTSSPEAARTPRR